jgi:hypothetical protein
MARGARFSIGRTLACRQLAAMAAALARRMARSCAFDRKPFLRFRIASQMRAMRER